MKLALSRFPCVETKSSFRCKATFWVALASIALLVPIAVLESFYGLSLTGLAYAIMIALLYLVAWQVSNNYCHQNTVIYALMPIGLSFITVAFFANSQNASLWCFPLIVLCYCMLDSQRARLANAFIVAVCLPLTAYYLTPQDAFRVGSTLAGVSVFSAIMVIAFDDMQEKLQQQAFKDPLTGLYNRLSLQDKLEESIACSQNSFFDSSILAIDIDHFKRINDRYGHDVGDRALTLLASNIEENISDDDCAFRVGGEEFLVLLNGCGERESNSIAEQLRHEVAASCLVPDESVTISIGLATYRSGEKWSQWVKNADDHLNQAKRLGRNRVNFAAGRSQLVM